MCLEQCCGKSSAGATDIYDWFVEWPKAKAIKVVFKVTFSAWLPIRAGHATTATCDNATTYCNRIQKNVRSWSLIK